MARKLKGLLGGFLLGGAVALVSSTSFAAVITYSDQSAFNSQLGNSFTDDYSDPAYQSGDVQDDIPGDTFSDSAMSAVKGQTRYRTTSFTNANVVMHDFINPSNRQPAYCGGCNGSFELDFTQTSYGTSQGVFGVGFTIRDNTFNENDPYATVDPVILLATVTFGNGVIQDFVLPEVNYPPVFFGLTSDVLIRSIHIGLPGGQPYSGSSGLHTSILDLTIGDAALSDVPAPAAIGLMLLGLAAMGRCRQA